MGSNHEKNWRSKISDTLPLLFFFFSIYNYIYISIYISIYLYIYLYISIYIYIYILYIYLYSVYLYISIYIYIEKKKAKFCILLQKNEMFLHSFTFFAKERNVLCVLTSTWWNYLTNIFSNIWQMSLLTDLHVAKLPNQHLLQYPIRQMSRLTDLHVAELLKQHFLQYSADVSADWPPCGGIAETTFPPIFGRCLCWLTSMWRNYLTNISSNIRQKSLLTDLHVTELLNQHFSNIRQTDLHVAELLNQSFL